MGGIPDAEDVTEMVDHVSVLEKREDAGTALAAEEVAPALEATAKPREYEGHPFFHSRVVCAGLSGFFVRGPVEPVASAVPGGLVKQIGALFVELPPDCPKGRWYSRKHEIEYPLGRTPKFADKEFSKLERDTLIAASNVLTELGLSVVVPGE